MCVTDHHSSAFQHDIVLCQSILLADRTKGKRENRKCRSYTWINTETSTRLFECIVYIRVFRYETFPPATYVSYLIVVITGGKSVTFLLSVVLKYLFLNFFYTDTLVKLRGSDKWHETLVIQLKSKGNSEWWWGRKSNKEYIFPKNTYCLCMIDLRLTKRCMQLRYVDKM